MRQYYSLAVFEPDNFDNNWVIAYYCSYSTNGNFPSESYWIVPGTLEV